MRYVKICPEYDDAADVLALSTEDGRILFYSTTVETQLISDSKAERQIPECRFLGQVGGRAAGLSGRVKDFEILNLQASASSPANVLVIAANSDGSIRLWSLAREDLHSRPRELTTAVNGITENLSGDKSEVAPVSGEVSATSHQIGRLIGTIETGNRITCLKAFVMTGTPGQNDAPSTTNVGSHLLQTDESSDESESESD